MKEEHILKEYQSDIFIFIRIRYGLNLVNYFELTGWQEIMWHLWHLVIICFSKVIAI